MQGEIGATNSAAPQRRLFSAGKSVHFFVVWSFLLFGLFGRYVFCCLGGGVFHFLLFGRGTGVHSLTGLPGSSLSDPTTKKTKQQAKKKKNTGSVFRHYQAPSSKIRGRLHLMTRFAYQGLSQISTLGIHSPKF